MLPANIFRLLFFVTVVVSLASCNGKHKNSCDLQPGDILFQDLDWGPLCDAIEKVTTGAENRCFSHAGLVVPDHDNHLQVLEAIGHGVCLTPVDTFLNRSFDHRHQPKVWVGRIDSKYKTFIPAICDSAMAFLNLPYDDAYLPGNNKYYCSEMIALAFNRALADSAFFLFAPMTFTDPSNGITFPAWEDYYHRLGIEIPEGLAGINPGLMSCNPHITIVCRYGEPDIKP